MKLSYRHLLLIMLFVLMLTGCKSKSGSSIAVQNDTGSISNELPPAKPAESGASGNNQSDFPDAPEDLEVLPNTDKGVYADSTGTGTQPSTCPPSQNGTDDLSPVPKDTTAMNDINDFSISEITDDIYARIYGRSYPVDCTLDLDELRYLTVLHYGFDGAVHVGELIVNKKIASATLEIFEELYAIEYPIEKIRLIDEYDADDESSMEDNNSSAFNYRYIAETTVLSNHALGFAIDINTLYNPYVYTRKDGSEFLQPVNAGDYVDRTTDCPYYIRRGDDCYEIFTSHGFTWGGDWETKKDYQHFEYKQ